MTITKQTSGELKLRVNACLTKLSDRDTLSLATNELGTIARTLSSDTFATFLSCLSPTDASDKPHFRRQCVCLLSILSTTHGCALSPHVPRMMSSVLLRRLHDPDSSVRAACVDAVACMVSSRTVVPPYSVVLAPLADALFREQDMHAQTGASLCLAVALDAAAMSGGDVDGVEVRRVLSRGLKLLRSESFKAKPALLAVVGSAVGLGCVARGSSKGALGGLVSTVVEFLGSEDWAARKAAAEVLEKVAAVVEGGLAAEFKVACVAALESKRFDKVKIVRETMNRALEMWREVLSLAEVASILSPKDNSPVSLSQNPKEDKLVIPPQHTKSMPSTSPVSSCSSTANSQRIVQSTRGKKPSNSMTDKPGLRKYSRSRVVPLDYNSDDSSFSHGVTKENIGGEKDTEDLSLIRKQLLQIENQQSSLMELLQNFIGSSQKGMSLLEKRVDGLEKVIGQMSNGLLISTRRILGPDSGGNTCCMMAGAEFLSPKFWCEGHNFDEKLQLFPQELVNA